jgi:hypothetical protein
MGKVSQGSSGLMSTFSFACLKDNPDKAPLGSSGLSGTLLIRSIWMFHGIALGSTSRVEWLDKHL